MAAQRRLSDFPTAPLSPLAGVQWTQWASQDINYQPVSYKAGLAVTQRPKSPPSTAVTTDQSTPFPTIPPS
jgi:hypothetical protein